MNPLTLKNVECKYFGRIYRVGNRNLMLMEKRAVNVALDDGDQF